MKQPLRTILWQCFVQTLCIVLGVGSLAVFCWLALGLVVLTLISNVDHVYAALDCGCVVVTAIIACRATWRVYFPPSASRSSDVATTVSAVAESADTTPTTPDDPRAILYRPLINPNVNDKTMWL